ncbi:DNA alkylation repair protein [Capnocytophaga canimorsus]|uniref:DNA alkylation repair protein n=1 Tax=Capnocytophaga canimorsus TaxID=28188 RepID=UPI003859B63A
MISFEAVFYVLQPYRNQEKAVVMEAYMKNQFPYLGIQAPIRKSLTKPFLVQTKKHSVVDWEFVEQCWACPYRELQYVALDYLVSKKRILTPTDVPKLRIFAEQKSWWDTIDVFDRLVGGIALKNPEVNTILLQWSIDNNKWIRRIAIDHQLLRKEQTNKELLSEIIYNNLEQTDFFIRKAIGWALRDYSKTNPQWVHSFIEKHSNKMSKLSLREAKKYLKNGERN